MGERERILELVREGILSVDEALDLLESVANKESKKSEERDFVSEDIFEKKAAPVETEVEAEPEEVEEPEDAPASEETTEETDETFETDEEKEQVEEELEDLANELNRYSVKIDEINAEITDKKRAISDVEQDLADRKEMLNEEHYEQKKELENKIINLRKEIELISMIEEIDSTEELKSLNTDLTKVMENLRDLENKSLTDEEIQEANARIEGLQSEIKDLTDAKNDLLKEVHSLKMKQWTTKAKKMSENIEIPEEWRDNASKTMDRASDIFAETSRSLSDVFRQTVRTTKDTLNNMDWKDIDINLNFPKQAKVKFEDEWLFEDTTATILDIKNANGDLMFKPSMNDNIKVVAKIKIHGNVQEATPKAAFEARSIIKIDADQFTFHVPNKSVVADIVIYLPKRNYDYIRSNSFNGDVRFKDITTRDIYVKATNGDITLDDLQATMLEVKGTNGDITLKELELRDLLVSTVNGDVRVVGQIQSSDVHTTNGDIRMTLSGEELIRVVGGSVNGDVKISLPEEVGLEIEAKSTFGKVKSRLSDMEASLEAGKKGKTHRLRRISAGEICRVKAQTTTGNVLFKDTDK